MWPFKAKTEEEIRIIEAEKLLKDEKKAREKLEADRVKDAKRVGKALDDLHDAKIKAAKNGATWPPVKPQSAQERLISELRTEQIAAQDIATQQMSEGNMDRAHVWTCRSLELRDKIAFYEGVDHLSGPDLILELHGSKKSSYILQLEALYKESKVLLALFLQNRDLAHETAYVANRAKITALMAVRPPSINSEAILQTHLPANLDPTWHASDEVAAAALDDITVTDAQRNEIRRTHAEHVLANPATPEAAVRAQQELDEIAQANRPAPAMTSEAVIDAHEAVVDAEAAHERAKAVEDIVLAETAPGADLDPNTPEPGAEGLVPNPA